MFKKKKSISLFVLCLSVLMLTGYWGMNAKALDAEITGCEIQENYNYGESFVMPDGKVSYKGEEKEAESRYLLFPSGKANESEEIVLSEDGEYQVVFKAHFDGAMITAQKSFVVSKRLLAVNSEKSTASVVDDKISVSLVPDDVFTYNKALDLSTATKEKPLLNMEFQPVETGTADAVNVKIRFTDLYDEENYVTITLKVVEGAWANGQIYISAGAANQSQVGVENLEDPTQTNIHRNDIFGTPVYFSMVGLPNSALDTQLKIYLDYAEKALYVDREIYSGAQNRLIVDLDDAKYFGTEIWEGFTTGEVKMTVFAENYQSTSCNFTISEINGETGFSATGDNEPPSITVTEEYETDHIPVALVGKPYKIFSARAFDKYDGETAVTASAYYKYFSESPVKLTVTDGTFTPEKEGTYVIEYKAVDVSGNVGINAVKVEAVIGEGLQAELNDVVEETYTGVTTKVISGINYTDNSGNVDYTIIAKNKATEEEFEIDKDTCEFCPMSDGEYEITVTVMDYVSTVSKTFDLKSAHTSQPQVYGTVAMQKYFISGATYPMPELMGYDFSSGSGVETAMSVFVTESDGKEKEISDNQYIPETAGDVTITYRLTVDGLVCEKSYAATVVDVGYNGDLCLEKYFVASEGAVTAEKASTCITYSTNAAAKLDFINFVQVKKLAFSFMVGESNNYNRMNIYLTDTLTGKQVKLSYRRSGEASLFSINDGTELNVESSFDGIDRNFALEYNNDTHMVAASTSLSVKIENFLDGSSFDGFTNSLALFAIELEEVTGASQLVINNLNSQSFNDSNVDRFAPEIIVKTKSGDRGINEEVELPGAFVYDTLDPVCSMQLVVTGPDNETVTDVNGVLLDGTQDISADYTIKLEQYGDYTIAYFAEDGANKTANYIYAITSKDVEAPSVTLAKHKESAKVGDSVQVAEATVEDNITEECTVAVYVYDPEGVVAALTDGKFEAAMAGNYTVRYMAFDESGNYAFASYEIAVK